MKKAFTMMEFIFVLIVIAILLATVIPNTRTNPLQEATVQVASDIRYTQHLAMTDDKYNAADRYWFKGRWQIVFGNKNKFANYRVAYTIFSDAGVYGGDASQGEIAKNPENRNQLMTGGYGRNKIDIRDPNFAGMKKLNLGMTYGIEKVQFGGGCKNNRISFDHLGRPMQGDQATMTGPYSAPTQRLITQDCTITLTDSNENTSILRIRPETGYISVAFQ